jgi:ADP-heptose:LPS heptosyltransferase
LGADALLVRAGALGDVLLLRRAVATLRRHHARILLIAPGPEGAALVGPGSSEVDALVAWERADVARLFTGATPEGTLRDWLRGVALAVVYSRSAEIASSLGTVIPRVVPHDPAPETGSHASEWMLRPLRALGFEAAGDPEPIRPTEADSAQAGAILAALPEDFVAVHPGSGSPSKNWPPDRFLALLDALCPASPWLLVEGPADAEAASHLRRRPGAVLARDLSARALGAVLARAGLFVGHDSGVSHLAAAWGAPTLALFGPTDPDMWRPVGPRVSVVRAPAGRMARLGLETVAEAARATSRAGAHPSG